MNKKILFLLFFFLFVWNLTILLFHDSIKYTEHPDKLSKDFENSESETIDELIAVYDHLNYEVNYIPLEEYIVRVISAEMPISYGLEALKAQAVAARTYTLYCLKNRNGSHKDGADVCTDYRHCQAYNSPEKIQEVFNPSQNSLFRQAVYDTTGQVLCFEGEVINSVYHASSDGATEDAKNVWGSEVPYLISVKSENENGMSGFYSSISLSFDGFTKKLEYAGYDCKYASKNISTFTNESKRVEYVAINLENGEILKIPGVEMRSIFALRSCSFDISVKGDNVVFDVRGYGHGVGMSQHGAKVMTQSGKTYEQVLLHYYSGCEVKNFKEIEKN